MAKTKSKPITPAVAAAMAAMLLSLAGCAGTQKSGTDTSVTDTETETGEAPASISAEEYAAMGMTAFATAGELEKAAGFGILSLDGAAAFSDYTAEEIVLDGGAARIRYAAGAVDAGAESGVTRRVIIMEAAPEGELDLTDRETLADVVVGDQLVAIAEDKAQSLKQAWWSADGYAYTVDTFNVEYADFKTLMETLCE